MTLDSIRNSCNVCLQSYNYKQNGVRVNASGVWYQIYIWCLVCGSIWCLDQWIWCLVCGELGRKDSFSQLQNFSSSIEEKSSKGTQKHFKLIRFCIKNVVRIQTNHTNWWWPSNISPSLCQSGGNPLKERADDEYEITNRSVIGRWWGLGLPPPPLALPSLLLNHHRPLPVDGSLSALLFSKPSLDLSIQFSRDQDGGGGGWHWSRRPRGVIFI